jgi:anthranilate phosphoribosyltransferase
MGIRTAFNVLGPLTNPLHATVRLMGVYSPSLVEPLAHVAAKLGVSRAFIVWGEDGTDEITVTARTYVCELGNGRARTYWIQPEDYGIPRAAPERIVGGTPAYNARLILNVLRGKESGPARDIVLMNAAYCLLGAGKASTTEEGLELAARSIDQGLALGKLEELRTFCQEARQRDTKLR